MTSRCHFSQHARLRRACQPSQPLLHECCLLQYFTHLNTRRHWRRFLDMHHRVTSLHDAQVFHANGGVHAASIRCSPTTLLCLICRNPARPGLLCLHGMPRNTATLLISKQGCKQGCFAH